MKIISSTQLKELDKYTIAKEPVASIDLMERAAEELTRAITHRWDTSFHIVVFAGPGNNGGDALAVARMLSKQNYHVEVFLFNTKGKLSEECQTNLERLKECGSVYFTEVSTRQTITSRGISVWQTTTIATNIIFLQPSVATVLPASWTAGVISGR